ncbi:vWA domain-containing protein [Methylocapsa aurea]|uniref:vWA domain-containing protein n=1 Tax=Methylocapsa aurea TaxID=663610 RepID=UPI000569B420|nr:vWA domain-containing protein [Methylocapsa aurea]
MNAIFAQPQMLWLLPLAALPIFLSASRRQAYPSLEGLPEDLFSRIVSLAVAATGIIAIGATILALAGPYRRGQWTERVGQGAETVLLIDRSGSMNETFAGRQPTGGEESKASAARRILRDFVLQREHDRIGVAAFSSAPMLVLPLTDRRDAVLAAVDAIDRPGLAKTDVGRGLSMALAMSEEGAPLASRVVLLVSDGAAVIDPRLQNKLRAGFARVRVNLYWLFLRTAGDRGIFEAPEPGQDTPQAMPERHLDIFFKSLGIPYKAFEVESPDAVREAVREIDRLENHPIVYRERIPRQDLAATFYALAGLATALLLGAKLCEVSLRKGVVERPLRLARRGPA